MRPYKGSVAAQQALGFLLLVVIACGKTWAATPTAVPPAGTQIPSASAVERHKLFMWKVSHGKSVIYIVGSLHLVTGDFYPLPLDMERAFREAQTLAVEIDDHEPGSEALQKSTLMRGLYPEGEKLSSHISKETAAALQQYIDGGGDLGAQIMGMRPWLASVMIPITELTRLGFDAQQGVDKHFLDEARATNKTIYPFETAEFQLNLLSGFNDDLQDKLLMSALHDSDHTQVDTKSMLHAWRNGDGDEMENIITREERESPELRPVIQQIVYDRNLDMAAKLEKLMKQPGVYFVVVGAGHVVGERGLVGLLKHKHYQVEQLSGS